MTMKARGLYLCCYDIMQNRWFVVDGPRSANIQRMPLHYERGHYWAAWPK